eukprot:COSAG02_NODE_1017_length_15184_cov_3.911966_3_plen_101_part_00
MEHLHALGAVDKRFSLTTKGRKMADFPLAPIYASMLLRSAEFGCTEVRSELLCCSVLLCCQTRPTPTKPLDRSSFFSIAFAPFQRTCYAGGHHCGGIAFC